MSKDIGTLKDVHLDLKIMIGFKVKVNLETKKAFLNNGIVSINLNQLKQNEQERSSIDFGGYDPETSTRYKWIDKKLVVGDKIVIEVAEILESSDPLEVIKIDSKDTVIEGKLRAYNALKKELEQEGLI